MLYDEWNEAGVGVCWKIDCLKGVGSLYIDRRSFIPIVGICCDEAMLLGSVAIKILFDKSAQSF